MSGWVTVLHWVHDNIALIFVGIVIGLFLVALLIFEAFRSHGSREDVHRLRKRLYQLERDQNAPAGLDTGPLVLSPRWVGVGAAATTSDGGCLILVEAASPFQRRAMLTVRVDGLPSQRNATITVGQRLEALGKSGIYSIELHAADTNQARFAISLRTLHVAE